MLSSATAGAFWRRALQALSEAFDPAREADGEDTVFQTRPAREQAEPRAVEDDPLKPPRRPEETLQ